MKQNRDSVYERCWSMMIKFKTHKGPINFA